MSADYVPYTAKLYQRSGVFEEQPVEREGIRLYMLSNLAQLLPPRGGAFAKTRPVWKVIDSLLNLIFRPKLAASRWNSASNRNVRPAFEELTELDAEASDFIDKHNKSNTFGNGGAHLQWILNYPWIISNRQHQPIFDRYEFSSTARQFDNYLLAMRDDRGELSALLLFSLRDGHLKLPFLFCRKAEIPRVVALINTCICRWQVSMFTTFQPELVAALQLAKTPALYKKPITRSYMVSKKLAEAIGTIHFQDGDGDVAFV